MLKGFFLILISFFLLTACKVGSYTPSNYSGNQIQLGNSGGVTGAIRTVAVLDNGRLFESRGIEGVWRVKHSLKGSQTRAIFRQARAAGVQSTRFSHPGSITYFIRYITPKRSYEIRWGDPAFKVPEEVEKFYQTWIKEF